MAVDYFASLGGTDEDEKRRELVDNGPAQQLGGESPVVTGTDQSRAGGSTENQEEKKTASGAFTNLNSFLDANAGRQFGQEVAGRVQRGIDDANEEQQKAGTTFRQKADDATVRKDDELISKVYSRPVDITSNAASKSAFTKMRDARYAGPQRLIDDGALYDTVAGKTERAARTAETTSTEDGRKAFLDQEYGKGAGRYDYTPGQVKLDNLLIQNDQGARDAFERARAAGEASKRGFSDLESQLEAYGRQAADATAATRAATRGALGIDDAGNVLEFGKGGTGAIQKGVDALDARIGERTKALDAEKAALSGVAGKKTIASLSPEQLSKLGLSPGQIAGVDQRVYGGGAFQLRDGQFGPDATFVRGLAPDSVSGPTGTSPTKGGYGGGGAFQQYMQNLLPQGSGKSLNEMFNPYLTAAGDQFYGVDPGKFLSFTNPQAFNRSSVANRDDLSGLQALAELAGVDQSWITDESQVGTQDDEALYNFDKDRFSGQVGGSRSGFENELKTLRDKLSTTTKTGALDQTYSVADFGQSNPAQRIQEYNALRAKYGLAPV